jgi:hypothetical protein
MAQKFWKNIATYTQDTDIAAAVIPFSKNVIYATPAYQHLMKTAEKCIEAQKSLDSDTMSLMVMFNGYKGILSKIYDLKIEFEFPWVIPFIENETKLHRYFKISLDPRFIDIKIKGKKRALSQKDIETLLDNVTDLKIWMELLPPKNFEFQGFIIFKATEVTENEIVSLLKNDFSRKSAFEDAENLERIQGRLKSLLKLSDIDIGLVGFHKAKEKMCDCRFDNSYSIVLKELMSTCPTDLSKSIYADVVNSKNHVIIPDISQLKKVSTIEQKILEIGYKNIALLPIIMGDSLIGILEIASKTARQITSLSALKIKDVIPLLAGALQRTMEETENQIESIIKQKCTAIHPTVEWRFRDAALNMISDQEESGSDMEEIVFQDVYALYGLSDIRGSSHLRNESIQQDIKRQLDHASEIISQAQVYKPLPIFEDYLFRLDSLKEEIIKNLGSDDENRVIEFMSREIEPLFDHIKKFDSSVEKRIHDYKNAVNSDIGLVYKNRKKFEDSVALLNESIAGYIDIQEEKAQQMFPHYFEKYKTDGVDYNIYIGQSLAENGEFDPVYLKNSRLWQLMMTCGIVIRTEKIKKDLPIPLETAHLILVQSTPIAIQFRFDEKRFDVNGAYNVKYEIVKKRIDKAVIKNTGERLTQPGKIAIVYSHSRDALEYHDYLKYLQAKGYITSEIEDVELEDLQGVYGLKALRITVQSDAIQEEKLWEDNVLEALSATDV